MCGDVPPKEQCRQSEYETAGRERNEACAYAEEDEGTNSPYDESDYAETFHQLRFCNCLYR